MLVNQMRAGALDLIVVYRSNVLSNPENAEKYLDIVEMNLPEAMAIQPYAVAKDSQHKYLMRRLLEAILTPASQGAFRQGRVPVDRRREAAMKGEESRARSALTVPRAAIRATALRPRCRAVRDGLFFAGLSTLLGSYVLLIVGCCCALAIVHLRSRTSAAADRAARRSAMPCG